MRGTSSGRGQIQGGLFVFPVAIVIALAVLVSGQVRSARGRALLVAVVALNGISLLLTFERTFWVAAVVGSAFVAVKVDRPHRARALAVAAAVLALAIVALLTLAPSVFTTARERLLASRHYTGDSAYHYRVVESRHVLDEIRRHPILGSGLGATIFWGQPWADKPPRHYAYSHVGYLALAWKLGIPAAMLLVGLIVWAVVARGPPRWPPPLVALRIGCQGALLAVLVAAITFPAFTKLSVTGVIGVMLAVCATPRARPDPSQTAADVP